MSGMSMKDLSKKVADIDFTMLSTRAEDGQIGARPMSNNGDVEYDGDSWFFTWETSRMVADIQRDTRVGLSLQGKAGILGKPPIFISIEAMAGRLASGQCMNPRDQRTPMRLRALCERALPTWSAWKRSAQARNSLHHPQRNAAALAQLGLSMSTCP
jgi:hypothetical protein